MKKKLLKITGILVLLMALVGFWGYNKYFAPDPEIQQQLTSQFGPEFFNSFEDDKVANNSVVDNKSVDDLTKKMDIPTTGSTQEKVKGQVQEEHNIAPTTPVNGNIVSKPITQEEINYKYQSQFTHLQNVAMSRLDTLYSAASQEYAQSKKTGTLNRSELVQKYFRAGSMLEASMDSQFYSTLNAMQAELIANNLPTDLVSVYKSEYEKAKSGKRSQLLAKVYK